MRGFEENNCRICKKVLCCKNCRETHENNKHGIFPNCDICLFGKAVVTNASEKLLEHLKSSHWPLRCIFCKRFFGTVDELKKHSKCPVGLKGSQDIEKSPYTPGQSYTESVYDSPPLYLLFPNKGQQPNKNQNMFSNLATSTPMQRSDDNKILGQIHEAITPVDSSEATKENAAKATPVDSDASLKRRVTFCETPMAESYRKQKNTPKKANQEKSEIFTTPSSGNSAMFYNIQEEQETNQNIEENIQQKQTPTIIITNYDEKPTKNISIKHDESTLWISATNISTDGNEDYEKSVPISHVTATPVVTKLRKRQVNVVLPTPVTKNQEENIGNNLIVPISEKGGETLNSISYTAEGSRNATSNMQEIISESSISAVQSRLWKSMSKFIKNVTNVMQGSSSVDECIPNTLKRRSSEFDTIDGPLIKRYKLTEIKCRRTIRQLPDFEIRLRIQDSSSNSSSQCENKFVDKATQTDDYLLNDYLM